MIRSIFRKRGNVLELKFLQNVFPVGIYCTMTDKQAVGDFMGG
jgi:hypothetical protein